MDNAHSNKKRQKENDVIDDILPHLNKVRKSGKGYAACCPVHGDRSPSMSITEKDGKVLAHCFACGASGSDLVEALGLPMSVLFEDEWQRPEGLTPRQKDELLQDKFVIEMADQAKTYADYKRVKLARERIKQLEAIQKAS